MKNPLDFNNLYISVSVVNNEEMAKLGKNFAKHKGSTDVLSFNIDEEMEDGKYYLGDVIVNKDQAEKQASEYSNTVEEEISELVAHGVLHLLGIHHEE